MSLDSILRATGKNLANCGKKADWYSPISDLTSLTVSDGAVSLPAVLSGGGIAINKNRIFTNGETFIIHANHTTPTGDVPANQYRYIIKPYKNNTVIKDITIDGWTYNQYYNAYWSSGTSKSFTLPKDTVNSFEWGLGFLAYGDISAGTVLTYSNIQIEKGTAATDYEPFHRILQSVKMPSNSENLTPYPYADSDKTANGITFVTGNYSGITINGATDLPVGYIVVDNLDLTAGNYTFSSGCNSATIPNGVMIQLCYLENGSVKGLTSQLSGSKLQETFSIDDTTAQKKFRVVIVLNQDVSDSFSVNDLVFLPTLIKSENREVLKVSYNSRNFFDKTNYSVQSSNNVIRFDISKLKIGEQYTISSNLPLYWIKISDRSDGWNSIQETSSTGVYNYTFTMQRNSNVPASAIQYLFLGTEKGKMITDINAVADYNIQIELGNKKTDYVPYFNMTVWEKQEIVTTNKLGSFKLGESMLA